MRKALATLGTVTLTIFFPTLVLPSYAAVAHADDECTGRADYNQCEVDKFNASAHQTKCADLRQTLIKHIADTNENPAENLLRMYYRDCPNDPPLPLIVEYPNN